MRDGEPGRSLAAQAARVRAGCIVDWMNTEDPTHRWERVTDHGTQRVEFTNNRWWYSGPLGPMRPKKMPITRGDAEGILGTLPAAISSAI